MSARQEQKARTGRNRATRAESPPPPSGAVKKMRKKLKNYLPDPESLRKHPSLAWLGDTVFAREFWSLNRRRVADGAAIGVFWCFIPIPGQMFVGIATAILLRANIPVAAAGAFISNPLTSGPMLVANYYTGNWLLGRTTQVQDFDFSMHWLWEFTLANLGPVTLGAFANGFLCAVVIWLCVRGLWRWQVAQRWRRRPAAR